MTLVDIATVDQPAERPPRPYRVVLAELVRDLRRTPELFRQLDITITRTDAIGPRAVGSPCSGHDRPLILNDEASERRRALLLTLRQAAAPVPYAPRAGSPKDCALAILTALHTAPEESWLTQEFVRRLHRVFTKAWGIVDARPEHAFAGRCRVCNASITGPGRKRVLRCRCGAEHDAAYYREWMEQEVEHCVGTAEELARVLPEIDGAMVKAMTIWKWHARGKITGETDPDDGSLLFRIGDVLALHRARRLRLQPVNCAA